MKQELLCYCGNLLYFDTGTGRYLCPSRFDGEHSAEKQREHSERLRARNLMAAKSGSLGGNARAQKLTPERRTEIASNAARSRWQQRRGGGESQ